MERKTLHNLRERLKTDKGISREHVDKLSRIIVSDGESNLWYPYRFHSDISTHWSDVAALLSGDLEGIPLFLAVHPRSPLATHLGRLLLERGH